jgi:HlyD family secretion protein
MKLRIRSLFIAAPLFLALVVGVVGYRRWEQGRGLPAGLIQVNGRIEGDHIILSGKFAGRIANLYAREGDAVRPGQAVARLDDAQTRQQLREAVASLRAAMAQEQGAGASVTLTSDTGDAQIRQTYGQVQQAESGIDSANASALSARATVCAAEAAVASAQAGKQQALAALAAARAEQETAAATVRAAVAQRDAAEAQAENLAKDAGRYSALAAEGASSEQTRDAAVTAARAGAAQRDSAREQVHVAEATELARAAEVGAAQEQAVAADAAIAQAQAQLDAARQQADAAQAAVAQARGKKVQAVGQYRQARTAPTQVAVSKTNRAQAAERIWQARATVDELKSVLRDMDVVAPTAGVVATRLRDVGEVVSAGTPILDVVDLDRLYLKAYVPEDQIGHIHLGCPARIYVDAYPDAPFEATLTYISATAEFTPREVQTPDERVKLVYAVKLTVKSNPQHRLTPGMVADAMIQWKEGVKWQKPRWQ